MDLKQLRKNKNTILYLLSITLSAVAVGIFSLVFNLHISLLMKEKTFLSNFFLLGNISMALGGILTGKIIDRYNKK